MDTPKSDTAKIVRVKAIVNSKIVMQGDAMINNVKDHNADIASVALIEHEKEDTKAKSPNKKTIEQKNGIEEEIYGDQSSWHCLCSSQVGSENTSYGNDEKNSSGVKVFFVKDVGLHDKYMILNFYQTFCMIQLRRMTLSILLI